MQFFRNIIITVKLLYKNFLKNASVLNWSFSKEEKKKKKKIKKYDLLFINFLSNLLDKIKFYKPYSIITQNSFLVLSSN